MTIGVRTKPKPPATVSCSAVVLSTANATSAIDVNWPAPPGQGQPVAGFAVYRNGDDIASVSAAVRSYRDAGASYGVSTSYQVLVISANSVRSAARGSNATKRPRRPTWSSSTPSSLSGVSGGQTTVAYASDPDSETVSYTLTTKPDAGYSITPAGMLTLGSTSGNTGVRAVDPTGLYAQQTFPVTIQPQSDAHYIVSVSGSTVQVRKTATGQTWTGTTISGSAIGATPGNVIEFQSGTYPKLTIQNFAGTAGSRITLRNESGKVVTIEGTTRPLEVTNNQYLTFDGSNGMGDWSPYDTSASHGFRVTRPLGTTVNSQCVKHFGYQKGITYKRVEVDGRRSVLANDMMYVENSDTGVLLNDQSSSMDRRLKANDGKYNNEDILFYECYVHNTANEGLYLGINYLSYGLPNKDVRVKRCRLEQIGSGAAQHKCCWYGTDNGYEDCVVMYSGTDLYAHELEAGHGQGLAFSGNGYVRRCLIVQTRESAIKSFWDDGPNPQVDAASPTGFSEVVQCTDDPTHYNRWPVWHPFPIQIENNVVIRAGGTPCIQLVGGVPEIGGTRPTNMTAAGHGITVGSNCNARNKVTVISNTIIDAVNNGINLGSAAAGGIIANNIVLGSGDSAISGSSGQTVIGNITSGVPADTFIKYVSTALAQLNEDNGDDLRLKVAKPVLTTPASTRGLHYTETDKNGVTRGTGSSGTSAPDQGAYEYTGA